MASFSNLLKHFQCSRRSSLLITKSIKSTMFPQSGKAVTLIKETHPLSLAWSAWRKSMLHFSYFPFTTVSLIIVSLQICSQSWHAAEVRPVVIRIASFFRSFFLLVPFHFSICRQESNTVLSKGSCTTVIPAAYKRKPVTGVRQGLSWLSTLHACPEG